MLTNTDNKKIDDGNGVTTVFSFPFPIFVKNDLKVYKVNKTTAVATLQVLDTDYTVTISPTTEGGSVTYAVAPTSNEQSLVYRDLEYTQPEQFPNETNFPEERIETMGDRAAMLINQLREAIGRALKLPITSTISDLTLPAPSAGKTLKWNDTETGLENSTFDVDDIGQAVSDAQAAQAAAATAQGLAETAQAGAEAAESGATTQAGLAATARTAAETAQGLAETAQGLAEDARDLAQTYAQALTGTSVSSVAIGTGAKTFTTQAGKQWVTGDFLIIADSVDPSKYMWGQVTSYTTTSLVMNILAVGGSGTLSAWNISISGIQGATGPTGATGDTGAAGPAGDGLFNSSPMLAKTGTYTLVASDRDKLVTLSGTFTLTLPAIVDGYVYKLKNIGSGTITIAPDGAETSDVTSLAAGESVILVGDLANTKWRSLAKDAGGGATHSRGTFGASDLTYTFTIATPTVAPTTGAVYTHNSKTYTVVSYAANVLVCTGTGYPTSSGTLTKSSGTGDATLTFTAFTATYTITHNKALSAPYTFCADLAGSDGKLFWPDDITGSTNSAIITLTNLGTVVGAGTCGYDYL